MAEAHILRCRHRPVTTARMLHCRHMERQDEIYCRPPPPTPVNTHMPRRAIVRY